MSYCFCWGFTYLFDLNCLAGGGERMFISCLIIGGVSKGSSMLTETTSAWTISVSSDRLISMLQSYPMGRFEGLTNLDDSLYFY